MMNKKRLAVVTVTSLVLLSLALGTFLQLNQKATATKAASAGCTSKTISFTYRRSVVRTDLAAALVVNANICYDNKNISFGKNLMDVRTFVSAPPLGKTERSIIERTVGCLPSGADTCQANDTSAKATVEAKFNFTVVGIPYVTEIGGEWQPSLSFIVYSDGSFNYAPIDPEEFQSPDGIHLIHDEVIVNT